MWLELIGYNRFPELLPLQKGILEGLRAYAKRLLIMVTMGLFASLVFIIAQQVLTHKIVHAALWTTSCFGLATLALYRLRMHRNALGSMAAEFNRLDSQGRWKEAASVARETLRSVPLNPAVTNNVAYALIMSDANPRLAMIYAERALLLASLSRDFNQRLNVFDTVGWIYYKNGFVLQAEKYLRAANTLAPSGPLEELSIAKLFHFMTVLVALGKDTEAKGVYHRMLSMTPHNTADEHAFTEANELASRWK